MPESIAGIQRRDVTRMVWRGLGFSLLLWVSLLLVGVSVALPVVVVIGYSLAVATRLVAATRPEPSTGDSGSAGASGPAPDRALAGFLSWQDRLSWAVQDMDRFEHGVRPQVVQLADRLLAERHAVSRTSHPALARQILGERLWSLATTAPSVPGQARAVPPSLPDLVHDLEQI